MSSIYTPHIGFRLCRTIADPEQDRISLEKAEAEKQKQEEARIAREKTLNIKYPGASYLLLDDPDAWPSPDSRTIMTVR